jgi:hypothetical protein
MKTIIPLTLLALFPIFLSACAGASSQLGSALINPGDQVGDFLITTGKDGDFTYRWDLACLQQGDDENYSCTTKVGSKVNISVGVFDQNTGKLEAYWSGLTYDLYLGSRPVNYQAFGYIDANLPERGKVRLWNVVLVPTKPGVIMIHDSGEVDGQQFKYTNILKVNAP